jgi:aryl-alcohol dehydrogenase-like predicted oxidoreductase
MRAAARRHTALSFPEICAMSVPKIQFGRTGLKVSRLALGTMTFGLQTEESVAQRIMDKAVDGGINFLDTADVYPLGGAPDTVGRTEEIVGRWLKGKRSKYIVATKAVGATGPNDWDKGASRKHLLDAIDLSLKRLQTDYVDLYQLHSDDDDTPLDETIEALDVIVKSGRARYVGVSNFLAWRLATALGRADVLRLTRFISVQPRYSLLFREIERELLPLTQAEGLAVIPYNPLAGGMLTGKHNPKSEPTPGTRFTLGSAGGRYRDRYWNDRAFDSVAALRKIADEAGVSLTKLSLAWVLANPAITAPLLGASKPEQLDETLAAVDYKLSSDLKAKLDEITHEYRFGDAVR